MNMNNYPAMLIVHHLEAEGVNWTVEPIHNIHKNENGGEA
jgi:N-acetylmuramoyl-L-alanine amidase